MSANRWTPGPWIVVNEVIRGAPSQRSGFRRLVATTWDGAHKANARLIAAAPELAEALAALLERYVDLINCGDCGNWDPETEQQVIAARAALRKARGEA